MRRWLAALGLLLLAPMAWGACSGSGASYSCTSGSTAAQVQSAVDSVTEGGTVSLAAGSYNWGSTRVELNNKAVWVKGAGAASTTITCTACFYASMTASKAWRISDMKLTATSDASSVGAIYINGSNTDSETSGWAVDGITFTYQNTSGNNAGSCLYIEGQTYGVVWGNTFNSPTGTNPCAPMYAYAFSQSEYTEYPGGSAQFDFHCDASGATTDRWCGGEKSFVTADNAGTTRAIFFEDNTVDLSNTQGGYQPFVQDCVYGCSVVIRYNTLTNAYGQNHATRYNVMGGKHVEVYGNTWACEASSGRCFFLRSGAGYFHHNKFTGGTGIDIDIQRLDNNSSCVLVPEPTPMGYCDGTAAYDGNSDAGTGWPCVGQPGRGKGYPASAQSAKPLYAWKNGTETTCLTGGTCDESTQIAFNGACSATEMAKYLKTIGASPAHGNGDVEYVNPANIGYGARASRSGTCTKWQAYWSTDAGGNWNTSNGSANDGCMDQCTATNTWTNCAYTPAQYPHATRTAGGSGPPAPTNFRVH